MSNINVGRTLVGGRNNQSISETVRGLSQSGATPSLVRAVVLEVIFDPEELTNDARALLADSVTNPEFLDNVPPNSIIARVVGSGQDNLGALPTVFYPAFQSHLMLPLQAGEHVWIMYDDFGREGISNGKWLTRVHENYAVEDSNFTHSDRRFDPGTNQQLERTSQQANRGNTTPPRPSFPNGGGTVDSYSLAQSGSTNPYEEIYRNSESSKIHSYEAVPHWIKRPQEFVLQGMNNSLICLGQDRTGPAKAADNSKDRKANAGSVDIVCGRGRYPLDQQDQTVASGKETSAFVVENTRGKMEVDKTPFHRRKRRNKNEGNPNLKSDAARIFVSMNSEADNNFKVANGQNGITYPTNTLKPEQPASQNGLGNSYIVEKADHIRLIARTEDVPNPPGGRIDGTLLLVKEGQEDNGLAFLYFDKEGRVQLDGKKVFLGQAATADPNSSSHAEPYIKWSVYNAQINELKAQIKSLTDHVQSLVTTYQTAFANSYAIPFVPIASLVAAGTTTVSTTQAKVAEISGKLDTIRPEDAKSNKIFGE